MRYAGHMPDRVRLRSHRQALSGPPLAGDVDAAWLGIPRDAGGLPYRGYGEIVDRCLGAAEDGARVRIIGESVERMPLCVVELGPQIAPASTVVMAGLHPIEWIGVEVLLALLDRLCARPPQNRCIMLLPLTNVDGYRRVEDDLRAGRRRWRRYNTHGVDLNRNWPTHFRSRCPWLGRRRSGARSLSEPETAAVAAALDRLSARAPIDVVVSLHSFGRMLLVPYGGRWRAPPDAPRLHAAAHAVARGLAQPYRVRQVSHWLPGVLARGIEIDTMHERYGALSLLVECGRGGLCLREPASWLHPFRWYNPGDPGPEIASVSASLEPLVRGHGPEPHTRPVVAQVRRHGLRRLR